MSADQPTLHELIERAESRLDDAAVTLRQVRIEIAAGHLPVRLRSGRVTLDADEAGLALDAVTALAKYNRSDPRLADLDRLIASLKAQLA